MLHRYGAYLLLAVHDGRFGHCARAAPDAGVRAGATMALGLTLAQVVLGVCNVLLGTPPWLSALHLATAAALLAHAGGHDLSRRAAAPAGAGARRAAAAVTVRDEHRAGAGATARRLALAYLELDQAAHRPARDHDRRAGAAAWPAHGFPGAAGSFWGALLGIALAAASAASFNHYSIATSTRLMRRTAARPLPSGLLPPSHALGLGFVLGRARRGSCCCDLRPTRSPRSSRMASIFYYAVVYTVWLKRRTPQNIVIGGGAGASAPLIAWAAVTGEVSLAGGAAGGDRVPVDAAALLGARRSTAATTTRAPASRCCR